MKITKSTGLKMAMEDHEEHSSFLGRDFIFDLLLSSLGILSLLGIVFYGVNLSLQLEVLVPFTLLTVSLSLYTKEKGKFWVNVLPLVFAVILSILTFRQTSDGFFTLLNGFRESLSFAYLKVLLPFEATGESLVFIQMVFIVMLTYPMAFAVKRKNTGILGVLCIGLTAVFLIVRLNFAYIPLALFTFFILMAELNKNYGIKGSFKVITYLLILGLFAFSFIGGQDTQARTDLLQENLLEARTKLLTTADQWVHGKKSILPEGDFTKLKAFNPTEEPVLEIIMAKPDSLYLKGFVGSQFRENRWQDLAKETIFEKRDLFYWLKEEGFHGEAQMALLERALEPEATSRQMIVRNTSSRRKYLYTPYEMVYDNLEGEASGKISDVPLSFINAGKNDPYGFKVMPNEVKRYTTLGRDLEKGLNEKDSDVLNYLQKESHYNQFVYEAYLELEEEDKTLLQNLLGTYADPEGSHLPYDKVKEKILMSLYDRVYYNEETEFTAGQGSFLQTFLETGQEGYSVHYATAATLMFRYYGIPARYVEGYLITPEDVEGVLSNAQLSLDDTHSHAWTEFYQDGVGWIPFETTPPYLDIMEKADALERLPDDPGSKPDPPPEEENSIPDEDKTRQGLTELILIKAKEVLRFLLIGLLFALVLMGMVKIVLKLRKRKELKQDFQSLEGKTKREQSLGLFSQLLRLLLYFELVENLNQVYGAKGKIPGLNENEERVAAAFIVAQKAKYSEGEITSAQANQVREAYDEILHSIKEKASGKERFKHRFIDVVYL